MRSARNPLLLALAAVLAAVTVATVAGAFSRGDAAGSSRIATQSAYERVRADLGAEADELEFLLIHYRQFTSAELGDQLAALGRRSRAQARTLGEASPPPAIGGLVATLRGHLAAQAAALTALAGRARVEGEDAVRAARPALRAQAEQILDARRRLQTAFLIGS
jgi:hypothetical protein